MLLVKIKYKYYIILFILQCMICMYIYEYYLSK